MRSSIHNRLGLQTFGSVLFDKIVIPNTNRSPSPAVFTTVRLRLERGCWWAWISYREERRLLLHWPCSLLYRGTWRCCIGCLHPLLHLYFLWSWIRVSLSLFAFLSFTPRTHRLISYVASCQQLQASSFLCPRRSGCSTWQSECPTGKHSKKGPCLCYIALVVFVMHPTRSEMIATIDAIHRWRHTSDARRRMCSSLLFHCKIASLRRPIPSLACVWTTSGSLPRRWLGTFLRMLRRNCMLCVRAYVRDIEVASRER